MLGTSGPCRGGERKLHTRVRVYTWQEATTTTTATATILDATRPPTSPANQQAGYVHRLDAGVVIRSVESSGAPNSRASEASLEAFGASWGPLGDLLGASWGPLGGLLGGPWGVKRGAPILVSSVLGPNRRQEARGPSNGAKMVAKRGRRGPLNAKPRKPQK